MSIPQNIVIVGGCGHVGLPLGIVLATRSNASIALLDIDATKIDEVNSGKMPFREACAEKVLQQVIGKSLRATLDTTVLKSADVVITVIGTPVDEHLNPTVTELYRNIDRLLEQMKTDSLLILRSTVYPGMTNLVYNRVRARGRKIHVAFCPERIAEGNNIQANEKVALDLNPVTRLRTSSKVRVVEQDICQSWAVDSNSMDVVFSSNFFEHLPSKEALQHCFLEIHRVLRPGGKVIAMGPNIRFCYDEYWDFMDHYLALSDRSMVEALELAGFQMQAVVPRFLPYTMARKRPQSPALVRIYLSLPFAWRILGKQFLVIARKAHA